MQENWQKYVAEAFATFVLVLVSAGAVLSNWQGGGSLQTLGVALAYGAALTIMIYSVWHISGAHLNPAVTVALWATGHVKTLTAIGYVLSQLVGAVVAAIFLKVIYTGVSPQYFLGDTILGPGVTPGMGILVEALFTFVVVWVYFATLVDKHSSAAGFGGLCVGLALTVGIMVSSVYTMGALNPARSFGPALVASHWGTHFVYWVGPVIGALVAGFLHHFVFMKKHA